MISDRLKKIIETFESKGTMSFLDPATEKQISAFEKKNGFTFPEEYREWLTFSDGGELFLPAGMQFYGVAHMPLIDRAAQFSPFAALTGYEHAIREKELQHEERMMLGEGISRETYDSE